jgi:hypothetical protein
MLPDPLFEIREASAARITTTNQLN